MSFITFDNLQNLKAYCENFDQMHGCDTIFTTMPLEQLRDLLNRPYEHEYLNQLVEQMFSKKTVVFSNDLDVPESPIGKLNSFYLINCDLRNNTGFYSPMSVTLLQDRSILHPGSTRLLYSHLYTQPVSVMITNYTKNKITGNDNFCFDPARSVLHSNHSKDPSDPYIPKKFRNQDCWFKQLVDSKVDTNNLSYHVPRQIKPPRIFQLQRKTVTANNVPILRYIKKNWRIVLE